MADFKKIPDDNSGEPFFEFNDSASEMLGQFAIIFWPLALGGIAVFLLLFRGYERTAIPVGIAAVFLQAWMMFG
ncbi:MAG TPA: hypothetical protein VMY41_06245 [Thermohalobaculum sp.]|nr:hypothetical protein [Thermohalobaculum sp.]